MNKAGSALMMRWRLIGLIGVFGSIAAFAQTERGYELQDVDLSGWDCLNKPAGDAITPETEERNRQKNRSPVDVTGMKVLDFDMPGFVAHIVEHSRELHAKRRRDLDPERKNMLARFESEVVSLTGWLNFAFESLPESTNCMSEQFVDWHLEVFGAPSDHPPQIGDPTPVICEITPRTESAVYRSGVRIQNLAPFLRLPDIAPRTESLLNRSGVPIQKLAPSLRLPENSVTPTSGGKPHKVRITGFLFWDDEHIGPNDLGPVVLRFNSNGWERPWRATMWEIHPVLKIEDLGTE